MGREERGNTGFGGDECWRWWRWERKARALCRGGKEGGGGEGGKAVAEVMPDTTGVRTKSGSHRLLSEVTNMLFHSDKYSSNLLPSAHAFSSH